MRECALWSRLDLSACRALVILCLIGTVTGCDAREGNERLHLSKALGKVGHARGAHIYVMPVVSGVRFVPKEGMGKATEATFDANGWLVFIDEAPDSDWAHQFKLIFVRQVDGTNSILFDGRAMPDFQLLAGDRVIAKRWEKY